MDEAQQLVNEYMPYARRAAKWFCYESIQSRVSYDDLVNQGMVALMVMKRRGQCLAPPAVRKTIRRQMLNYALQNYSPFHVTSHAFKKTTCEETHRKATESQRCSIPLHEIVENGQEYMNSSLYAEMDDSGLFVSEFLEKLTPRERTVCLALMDDVSEHEISRRTGIPHITVRRTHEALRKKLRAALEDPA